ncbi:unnamed protein product [Diamesa tonsa]
MAVKMMGIVDHVPGLMGYYYPLYIGCMGNGISIIVADNYINLRQPKGTRAPRIATGYFFFFVGIQIIGIHFYKLLSKSEIFNHYYFNKIIGIIMISVSSLMIFLLTLNGIQQLTKRFYNYKISLDKELSIVDTNNSIFITNYGDERTKSLHRYLTFMIICCKCFGVVIFNYDFFMLTNDTTKLITGTASAYIFLTFMTVGNGFGSLLMRRFRSKLVFIIFGNCIILTLILLCYTYWLGSTTGVGICLWLFYFSCGVIYSITSINILEITNLRYTELAQTIAYTLELSLIATVQYNTIINEDPLNFNTLLSKSIISITIVVALIIIVIFHMPNTHKKSHITTRDFILSCRSPIMWNNKRPEIDSI